MAPRSLTNVRMIWLRALFIELYLCTSVRNFRVRSREITHICDFFASKTSPRRTDKDEQSLSGESLPPWCADPSVPFGWGCLQIWSSNWSAWSHIKRKEKKMNQFDWVWYVQTLGRTWQSGGQTCVLIPVVEGESNADNARAGLSPARHREARKHKLLGETQLLFIDWFRLEGHLGCNCRHSFYLFASLSFHQWEPLRNRCTNRWHSWLYLPPALATPGLLYWWHWFQSHER